MGQDRFVAKADRVLRELDSLQKPIRDLRQSHWQKQLEKGASDRVEAGELGMAKLSGKVVATAHLTRSEEPPLALHEIQGDPREKGMAWASIVVSGEGSADLVSEEPVSHGSIRAGAGAGASIALAHHRPYTQAKNALLALTELLGHFTVPYDLDRVRRLGERDLLQAQFAGGATLHAHGAWQWGLMQELAGTTLEKLAVQAPVAIKAGATLGLTFKGSLSGELRILVEPGRETDDGRRWVRVRLFKRRATFVGIGLGLETGLAFVNLDAFLDSVFHQLLRVPDGLVEHLRDLHHQIGEIASRLDELEGSARQRIADAAGTAASALGIDDLRSLVERLETMPPAVRKALGPFRTRIASLLAALEERRNDLEEFVDEVLGEASTPLDEAAAKVASWIAAYDELRARVRGFILERAEQGIRAEFEAGINRTRAGEALVDLEFDLHLTAEAYRQALRGNFAVALEKAGSKNGAAGVELRGGMLKEISRSERFSNLQLNLFGFELRRDLQSFQQVEVETDLGDGKLWIRGRAGAALTGSFGRQARALAFLFDLAGAAREEEGKLFFTDPTAGYRATLTRTASLEKDKAIRRILPLHVSSAAALGELGPDEARRLEDALLAQAGRPYSYELRVVFPTEALQRVFLIELGRVKRSEIRDRLWGTFRRAVELLDLPIPAAGKVLPLSLLITQGAREQVEQQPGAGGWKSFKLTPPRGFRLDPPERRLVWVYFREAYLFIEAYCDARQALVEGKPARRILKRLRRMAAEVERPPGFASTQPLDAKYLMLAHLAGTAMKAEVTLERGAVRVRL